MGGKVRFVIAGHSASEDARERAYDPAIHPPSDFLAKKMDARVKPAHDGPNDGEHRAWRDRTACPI